MIALALGALWGVLGYALLWGHTPFVVHRPFVESVPGTILLLPVRVVLWSIHGIERAASRTFALSESSGWIGLLSAAAGAAIVLVVLALARLVRRR